MWRARVCGILAVLAATFLQAGETYRPNVLLLISDN